MSQLLVDDIVDKDGGNSVGFSKGINVGASSTVTGNLNVTGVLTYEDVTNIDSVGLITAQTGVNVSGGNLVVGSGLTVAASTGVATFSGTSDVHLLDNVQLNIGDGSDCIVYHDATHTYITNTTGDLRITDTSGGGIIIGSDSLDLRNSARDEKYFTGTNGGAAEIYFNNTKRIESTNTGAIVTGILTATTGAVIGAGITANNTNLHFNKTLIEKTSIAGGLVVTAGVTTVGAGLSLADNIKARFGTSGDLEIYHSGSESHIQEQGTGGLIINGSVVTIKNPGDTETIARFTENGGVDLNFDNSTKLATTNTGVVVTGIATASDYYIGVGGTSVHTALGTKASTGKAIAMAMVFG